MIMQNFSHQHTRDLFSLRAIVSIVFIITFTQNLRAIPNCGAILGTDICIIGDMHTTYEKTLPTIKSYTNIIDSFIQRERRKPHKTAIILEVSPHYHPKTNPNLNGYFLQHIAQHNPSSRSDVTVINADQRDNVMSCFEALNAFWHDYIFEQHQNTMHYLNKNKKTICDHYSTNFTDALIDDCLDDLTSFLQETQKSSRSIISPQSFRLFTEIHQELSLQITALRKFFETIENKEETTVLEAVLQKTIEQNELSILEDTVMGSPDGLIDQLSLHIFNLCVMLEIIKNVQSNNRVVIITGTFHAFYLIYYLRKHLALPIVQLVGFDTSYNTLEHPKEANPFLGMLKIEDFANLIQKFSQKKQPLIHQ